MRINRSLLNWGVFLIALGAVPLAVQQGWADASIAGDLWRLWPLILVGIGLGLILRWTPIAWLGGAIVAATFGLIFGALIAGGISGISSACVGPGSSDTATTEDSDFASATAFSVELELSCGELVVERGSGATWAVEAEHDPDHPPTIEGSTTALSVTQGGPEGDLFVLLSQQPRNDWNVELPATASISMEATLNASDAEVSLGEAPLALLSSTVNASNATFDLGLATTPEPARLDLTYNASAGRLALPLGSILGSITLNVSDLELCIPAEAEVRLELETVLATDDVGESGLSKARDGWQSTGYDTASSRIDLAITSTVSRISIERPEVCS